MDAPQRPRDWVRRWLVPALAAGVVALAAMLILRALRSYSLDDVVASVRAIAPGRIALAGTFAAASYVCLTWFDALGVRYAAGRTLAYRRAALASFTALSLGHTIGFSALSSGTIRFRFYSRWGLDAGEIAAVVVFCAAAVALGLATLGGIALLADPRAAVLLKLAPWSTRALGLVALAAVGLYLALAARLRLPFRVAGWRFRLPPPAIALAQVAVGAANFALVAACLHQVLADATGEPYLAVASVYVLANMAAIVAHVPGGLGVIEGVVLLLLPEANLIGPLIVFRLLYFFVPLAPGIVLLAAAELIGARREAAGVSS
jgi:uncharacterized membrane protein YbhN (UPF0104 family)